MFQFEFASVLNYRRQIEDVRQQEFARSRQEWEQQKLRLEQYQTLWRACLDQWRAAQRGTVAIHEVELYQRYMVRLRDEIRLQADRVRQCMAIMDEKRDIVLQAQKDRKVLEKLSEYAFARYQAERLKQETRSLDEIATQRYTMRKRMA